MTITAVEYRNARRGDAYTGRERDYLVTGTGEHALLDENDAILAAVAISPFTVASTDPGAALVRMNASVTQVMSPDRMIVAVQYGESGSHFAVMPTPTNTVEYEFNYQAPSVHIYQSLSTVSITSKNGPERADMFSGAIGVVRNADGTFDIEGVDTAPGNTTNSWTFTTTAGTLSSTYEQTVESLMGGVNNNTWRGRPAGSMRLVSASSQFSAGSGPSAGGKLQLRFGFQYEENVTSIQVGNITVPSKDGHDYLWVKRKLGEVIRSNGKKLLLPSPEFVIVERVFKRVNFGALGF